MQANLPAAQKATGVMQALRPLLRMIVTMFIAALGMLLFGTVGSLAYPVGGVGAIFGGIIGILVCFCVGCCATSLYQDFMPQDTSLGMGGLIPHGLAVQLGTHGNFTLILTVVKIEGVKVQGHMPWKNADIFLEVECGMNPIKRTCVNSQGEFNEQFRLDIRAADESMIIKIKDQDVFGCTDVGYVCIDIQQDIVDSTFPKDKPFEVEAGQTDKLRRPTPPAKARIFLSFDHLDNYSAKVPAETNEVKQQRRADIESQLNSEGNYGAVNFLSKLEFDTTKQIMK